MQGKPNLSKSTIDAGLGLVYRLNTLFNKAEDASMSGDFSRWDFILDRLFINLTYKGPMDIKFTTNEDGDITGIADVKLMKEERIVFDKFRSLIRDVRNETYSAIKKRDRKMLQICKEKHYNLLMTKDIWLRKIMMDRGLYLKEFDFDPSKALWGG